MIRAGEAGGFIPEAFNELSNHAEEAHKFKRFHWFIWYLAPRAVASIPLAMALAATLKTMGKGIGGVEGGSTDFMGTLIQYIKWPYGPMTLAVAGLMLLARWLLGMHGMRRWRHELGLRSPIYGPRARNESISIFSWTLSRLSHAGIPPNTAWERAVGAVPNLEMQSRLRQAGSKMHSGSRVSEVIFGSKLFPEEYAPVISTGELVGDVGGAMDQLERMSRIDYDESTKKARRGSLTIGGVIAILTSGLVLYFIVTAWYVDLPRNAVPEVFGEE
jgi:type II secretory pathway component PulF